MQIVIEIPNERYKWIKDHKGKTDFQTTELLYRRIRNGTPLPKGHGRLIDADELSLKWVFDKADRQEIKDAPTIIEADKGNKE